MNTYQQIFSDATGVTDAADLQEIENTVRDECPILNGLTRARLMKEARNAWALIQYLRTPEGEAEMARLMAEMSGC